MLSRRSFLTSVGALTAAGAVGFIPQRSKGHTPPMHSVLQHTPPMHSDLQPPVPVEELLRRATDEDRGWALMVALDMLSAPATWYSTDKEPRTPHQACRDFYHRRYQQYAPLTLIDFLSEYAAAAHIVLRQDVYRASKGHKIIAGVTWITVYQPREAGVAQAWQTYGMWSASGRQGAIGAIRKLEPQLQDKRGAARMIELLQDYKVQPNEFV